MQEQMLAEWPTTFENDLSSLVINLKKLISIPSLILLDGPVGAGKTTFAKVFCDTETMSPTYSVLTESSDILHGDFYRLKDSSEIIHLELALYLEDKNYFLLEWGKEHLSYLEKDLPANFQYFLLDIKVNKTDQSRYFRLSKLI